MIADVTRDGLPDVLAPDAKGIHVLVNRRTDTNRAPVITPRGVDITIDDFSLQEQYGEVRFSVDAADPDSHGLWVEWSVRGPGSEGVNVFPTEQVGILSSATIYLETAGTYEIFLTVSDQRGGVATAKVAVITVVLSKDIVLHMAPPWNALTWGRWSIVNDPSAASGVRARDENLGAPKVTAPAAQPAGWVEHGFLADPTQTYTLWLRLKADNNHWSNDSVWVQFSGATDLSGTRVGGRRRCRRVVPIRGPGEDSAQAVLKRLQIASGSPPRRLPTARHAPATSRAFPA